MRVLNEVEFFINLCKRFIVLLYECVCEFEILRSLYGKFYLYVGVYNTV